MEKVSMKQISKMSDSELAESARKIARETEERSNRKAAANAILDFSYFEETRALCQRLA